MQSDTIKLIVTYGTAVIVIVGGGLMLWGSRLEEATDFALVLAGFIGAAVNFLFGQESATRATRAAQRTAAAATTAAAESTAAATESAK